MQSGVNQGQVCPFEPKLCQNVATASRTPLEPLLTSQTHKNQKLQKIKIFLFTPFPFIPLLAQPLGAAALWGAPPVQFTVVSPLCASLRCNSH